MSTVQLNSQYETEADYQNAVKELADGLPSGAESTSTDPSVLEAHGKSFGNKTVWTVPTIVVFAQFTEDVVFAVNVSRRHRVPIIAYDGVTSLERNHVAEDGDLVAQSGAKWVDINATLNEKGIPLFFPTVVLPAGKVIKTRRRVRKCYAGFNGIVPFIGAEGTLGIVTEVTTRPAPVLPTRVVIVQFSDVHKVSKAAIRLLNSGVGIQCMELVDKTGMGALDLGQRATWTESDAL
ncbi:hypothetical protein BDY19DRAFT_908139 [Irpex rosettiformis]|uniref:Uncharacterized protein n=1 Tax=Irpex rosettiformis TaxID=378272 RepID=A0ACB8TY39_9APHY|nr:hypothetical protein BDY19DRAFT_908139 [Irpex rosettiformis]